MTDLRKISKIYFVGIGGIGMSALARYFKFHGKEVSGYDKTETILTRQLTDEGIPVHYEDNLDLAPKDAQLIVYTPAIPKDHQEWNYYKDHNYPMFKRSEVLGLITESSFNIAIAGTHGKTTITTMVAHLLRDSGYGCNAFLGGIAVNYGSNFWSNEKNVSVIEADEYDRSFLRLSPDIEVITAMDADHLDIYGDEETMHQAFIDFSGRLKPGGMLISKYRLPRAKDLKADRHITYSLNNTGADVYAEAISVKHGVYHFTVSWKGWTLKDLVLNMGGLHNVENIIPAIAIAHELGIEDDKIRAAVESFRGVKRRFEYIYRDNDLVFVDDYAHHPEELRALINGARDLFKDMECTVIFQPHLFTRTRDFQDEFAKSLELADHVYLLPIYPAREKPIEGVTSSIIADKMNKNKVNLVAKEAVTELIKEKQKKGILKGLLIVAGAGDIDTLVLPIRDILNKN
jgi:UDP-N-acetylmuramate--alanine ligase